MQNRFNFFNNNRTYYYLFIAYVVLFIIVLNVYKNLEHYEDTLKASLLDTSISMIDDTSTNILNEIGSTNLDFIHSNFENSDLREKNEKTLAILDNEDIKSLFILYIENKQLFFLLDTDTVEKAALKELFIPEETRYFDEVQKSQEKKVYVQSQVETIAFTLIKPIVQNGKTIAFLVIDYAENTLSPLSEILNTSVRFLIYLMFTILLLLFLFIAYVVYTKYNKYKVYYNPETNTLTRSYLSDNYEKIDFKNYYTALADIDFFKHINSMYGQENGDKIIVSVIKIISSFLDSKDMFIHYSGEEFLLFILKKNKSEKEFRNMLEEIRIAIERTSFTVDKESFSLTISIGASLGTETEKSLQDVIHKADTALYECKHNGRNIICYFDITQTKKLYREKLKEMIDSDKLVCYYQPIKNLVTHELHHYEALLRIEDGDNIIFPDKILPDLEDSYLYTHLTKRIIEYNIHKLRTDLKIKISINLSADDLINDSISTILAQNSDLADRLFIQILENKSIDYKRVELSLQKLKLFGYKICIDDFGSGYSNLNHLLNLSIDYLKIDGSIIKEIHHDKRAYSIVKTFALFCQQNDIEVIAEFIDNQEVVDMLKSFGVEYGQGWYFSKAVPYDTLNKEHI